MCEQIELHAKTIPSRRRRKLWEISEGHHCSILGTCLRRSDLKKFSKKKLFHIEPGSSDYQIHLALVGYAASRNPKSRAMHKFMEERYRVAVKRYSSVEDDKEVLEMWAKDLKRGAVAGAYWAIMTNQSFSCETLNEIYGQNHMLSHDIVCSSQREQRLNKEVVNKAEMLEEVLVSERQIHLQKQEDLKCEIAELKKMKVENTMLGVEIKKVLRKNTQLKKKLTGTGLSGELSKLKDQLIESNKRNTALYVEVETLKRALADSRDRFDLANETAEMVESQNEQLQENIAVLNKEVLSLETAMLGSMDSSCNCSTCDDQNTNRCPGPDLCGQTILYVGGLHKMISHYKKLVESHGGKFLHHDGGKEASRAILPKMLNTADAVLCPIDCVSHDACTCVKKICKRYQKPYVMMRSSGLSSLAKGLTEIVQ